MFWLLSASVFLVWALVHFTSPISPKFYVREPFSYAMLCTQVPSSSFSPCVCLCSVASSNLSCKHTSASSKCEHTGGFCLPLQFGWGNHPVFWGGRPQRDTPLYPLCLVHIYCYLFFPYINVWGTYILTSVFEGMGVFSPALSPGV